MVSTSGVRCEMEQGKLTQVITPREKAEVWMISGAGIIVERQCKSGMFTVRRQGVV